MSHWQVIAKASRAALIEVTAASNVLSISLGSAAASGEVENPGEQGMGGRFAIVMLQARACKEQGGKFAFPHPWCFEHSLAAPLLFTVGSTPFWNGLVHVQHWNWLC